MLKKLYDSGCLNYEKLIISNQKKLGLSPLETLVMIEILNLYPSNKNITADKLAEYILVKHDDITDALGNLLEKEFIAFELCNIDSGKVSEIIRIDGFFKKASDVLNNFCDNQNELYNVIDYLKRVLNKILTPNDIDIISSLVNEDSYTLKDFKEACEVKLKNREIHSIKPIVNALSSNLDNEVKVSKEISDRMADFFSKVK